MDRGARGSSARRRGRLGRTAARAGACSGAAGDGRGGCAPGERGGARAGVRRRTGLVGRGKPLWGSRPLAGTAGWPVDHPAPPRRLGPLAPTPQTTKGGVGLRSDGDGNAAVGTPDRVELTVDAFV